MYLDNYVQVMLTAPSKKIKDKVASYVAGVERRRSESSPSPACDRHSLLSRRAARGSMKRRVVTVTTM